MTYEGNRAGPNTDGQVHHGSVGKPQCRTVPDTALPPTVLVTELAWLNRDMASLCMRMMDRSASVTQQQAYVERLITAGERLPRRTATETAGVVIDGEVFANTASA